MKLKINFGTMIEVVRAALTANELATTAEYFSFGTNDLTQGTFSFSREDVEGKFLPEYMEKELLDMMASYEIFFEKAIKKESLLS